MQPVYLNKSVSKSIITSGRFDYSCNVRYFKGQITDAYRALIAEAEKMNAFCVPMICHYRLLDLAGNVLFTSDPVTFGDEIDTLVDIPAQSSSSRSAAFTFSRKLWFLKVTPEKLIPARLRRKVTAVEVFARPTVDPDSIADSFRYSIFCYNDGSYHRIRINPDAVAEDSLVARYEIRPPQLLLPLRRPRKSS